MSTAKVETRLGESAKAVSKSSLQKKQWGTIRSVSKCYWPEAKGYVIYSPRAQPEGNARGE